MSPVNSRTVFALPPRDARNHLASCVNPVGGPSIAVQPPSTNSMVLLT